MSPTARLQITTLAWLGRSAASGEPINCLRFEHSTLDGVIVSLILPKDLTHSKAIIVRIGKLQGYSKLPARTMDAGRFPRGMSIVVGIF
jgi:hypothetical protein